MRSIRGDLLTGNNVFSDSLYKEGQRSLFTDHRSLITAFSFLKKFFSD